MSIARKRKMRRKRSQGNMTPQKTDNNIIQDFMESKGDESPVLTSKE
jgi:hypothetical protein